MFPSEGFLHSQALTIAAALLADLHEGRISRIGGDTIEAACDAAGIVPLGSPIARERFCYLTTRLVVELSCRTRPGAIAQTGREGRGR